MLIISARAKQAPLTTDQSGLNCSKEGASCSSGPVPYGVLLEFHWKQIRLFSFPRVRLVAGKEQVKVLVLCRPCCLGVPQFMPCFEMFLSKRIETSKCI